METIRINYLGPYFAINAFSNYILFKEHINKVLKNFDNIKIGYIKNIKSNPKIPQELEQYVSKIKKNLPKDNLYNLYNNIENVNFKKELKILLSGAKGLYNSKKNTLKYSFIDCIEHELVHLASSYYNEKENVWQSGFINYAFGIIFAKALNEGYTELISRRIFGKINKCYNKEVRIVRLFELLFDSDKLQKYYFNNDIVSVINTLCKYLKKEDAIKLILYFDYGFDLRKQGNPLHILVYKDIEVMLCNLFKIFITDPKKQEIFNEILEESTTTKVLSNITTKMKGL